MTNNKRGTLYVGVTSNLVQRVYQHKQKCIDGFTTRYNLNMLVYYELHNEIYEAISREKQIKKWNRSWKIELIENHNPEWNDLYDLIL